MTKQTERTCEVCDAIFQVKYPSSKCRTCSKPCKNKIAKQITKKYFLSADNRKNASVRAKKAMWRDDVRQKYLKGMEKRDYKKENHPSWGMTRSRESRDRISAGLQKSKEQEDVDKLVDTIRENYEREKNDLFLLTVEVKPSTTSHVTRMKELIRVRKVT